MLRSMGSQRVGHDFAAELNWTCQESVPVHGQVPPHRMAAPPLHTWSGAVSIWIASSLGLL